MPALYNGSLWAGRRFYKRNDIHISDFYWNQSATGAGVEDMEIGGLKYSYAFSRKDSVFQKDYVTRHDFNVGGFDSNPGGELEFGLSYLDKPSRDDANSGWAVTVQHVQSDFLGGKNTLALQYGEGPGTGLGYTGDVTLDNSAKSWRVVEYFDWQLTPASAASSRWSTRKTSATTAATGLVVGGRASGLCVQRAVQARRRGRSRPDRCHRWHAQVEQVHHRADRSPAGPGFWARPEFRLYYTYASWNDAAQRAANVMAEGSALSDTGAFGNARHGSNFGVQVEHWW